MRRRVDRDLVKRLLREGHSARSASRISGCSDWTARQVLREITNDGTDDGERLGIIGWLVTVSLILLFIGALWLGMRRMPPPDGAGQ